MWNTIAGIALILLVLAHSGLGEFLILQPLQNASWPSKKISRRIALRILRFAWHLTSLGWLAMAAVCFGAPSLPTLALHCGIASIIIFFVAKWHLAWPLFGIASLAIFQNEGLIPTALYRGSAMVSVFLLIFLCGLHIYWASGGKRFLHNALPRDASGPIANPSSLMTFAVAAGLLLMAMAISSQLFSSNPLSFWSSMAIAGVFGLRAVGDFRYVGFSKRYRRGDFAQWDDRLFTPVVVFLMFGAGSALM